MISVRVDLSGERLVRATWIAGRNLAYNVPRPATLPIDKTNHMALYTEKFIAVDYLAGFQTQTCFFPCIEKGEEYRRRTCTCVQHISIGM